MNNLMIFENNEVEVFELNEVVYFNPYHVGKCLDIAERTVREHMENMNKTQVKQFTNKEFSDGGLTAIRKLNNAGERFLTESGVYKMIIRSRKPEAERFQDWVTDKVLPSIRTHGAYLTDKKIEEVLLNPDTLIALATQLKEERLKRQELELENVKKDQMIGELKPRADYTDRILRSTSLVNISQIAKDYGRSGKKFNILLQDLKIQYKQNDQWLLYSKFHNCGYTSSETLEVTRTNGTIMIKMNTKWTQKGRLFLYETLKNKGIIPLIEQEDIFAS